MPQVATHPHVTTWAGRKNYGVQVTVPTGVQTASASNSSELQSAVNNPANIVIEVDGVCDASTVEFLAAHSGAGQKRYIVGKAGARLERLVMFRAEGWVFTADGTTTEWLDFGDAKGSFDYNGKSYSAGTVFSGISTIDVKDVVIDRWRFNNGSGFLSYYNTDGHTVENLIIQNGIHSNFDFNSPREGVCISRPAWNGEMVGGSGSTTSTNKWDVRSIGIKIVNNVAKNPRDFFQNTGNGHVTISSLPLWAGGKQTGAGSLSDEGMEVAGNQFFYDEYVYSENGLPIRLKDGENPLDFKNGSDDADNPILIHDNIFWGTAPARGQGDGNGQVAASGHLNDPGVDINLHYQDCKNVQVYDNIFCCSNRNVFTGKGYSRAIHVEHNLFYNGAATLNGNALERFITSVGQNADPYNILLQDHTLGGPQRCDYNHIIHGRQPFANNTRHGDPAPSCVGNVALGIISWIGPLAGMTPQNCISDKSGFGTQVGPEVLGRSHDLSIEVRDPDNLNDPTAVVLLYMPDALLDASDAPTNQNRWVSNNEEPPGASNFGLSLVGVRKTTAGGSSEFELQAAGGTAPYVYAILSYDDSSASTTLSGTTLTINKGGDFGEVNVTARVTDAEGEIDTAVFTATFEEPQIPGVVWTTNSEPYPDTAPAKAINDGDLTFDGGWTGSTAGGVPASATGMWPVPHDLTLVRTIEALDDERDYYRTWEYTTDGVTWLNIPEFGIASNRKKTPLEWERTELNLQGVVGISRVGTGNSQGNEWQRLTEVRLYGSESIGTLNPPVCIAFETTAQPGDELEFNETQLAALDPVNGGNLLAFTGTGHSISPADAGSLALVDGKLKLVISEDFSGDISLTHTTESAEI